MAGKHQDIEDIAMRFRARVGLGDTKYVDGLTLLQKLKRHFKVDYVGVDFLDANAEGEYDHEKRLIRLPNTTLCRSNRGEDRAKMTIAHEVAHAILEHRGIANRSTTKSRAEIVSSLVARQESEAKRLAVAILAPFCLITSDMAPSDIARCFGLSSTAAAIRWKEFQEYNRIKSGLFRELPDIVVEMQRNLSEGDGTKTDTTTYLKLACGNCGHHTLLLVGVKILCVTCDEITDRRPEV